MSLELELAGISHLPARKIKCQAVPDIETLREAFERIYTMNPREDHATIEIELYEMIKDNSHLGYTNKSVARVSLHFFKMNENGRWIWVYVGPIRYRA